MSTRLIDPFGRSVEYLRLSVTDRCDLRCFYCLPDDYRDFSEPQEWLSFDEIERVIRAYASLGVQRHDSPASPALNICPSAPMLSICHARRPP